MSDELEEHQQMLDQQLRERQAQLAAEEIARETLSSTARAVAESKFLPPPSRRFGRSQSGSALGLNSHQMPRTGLRLDQMPHALRGDPRAKSHEVDSSMTMDLGLPPPPTQQLFMPQLVMSNDLPAYDVQTEEDRLHRDPRLAKEKGLQVNLPEESDAFS